MLRINQGPFSESLACKVGLPGALSLSRRQGWRIGWCPEMSVLQYYITSGIAQAWKNSPKPWRPVHAVSRSADAPGVDGSVISGASAGGQLTAPDRSSPARLLM